MPGGGNCSEMRDYEWTSARIECRFEPTRWIALDPATVARREGQRGIDQAADAQDRACHGWSDRAFEFVKQFAEQNRGRSYIGHDIVNASKLSDLPRPENEKAWGRPIQRAARAGVIKKTRRAAAPDPNRHGNLVPEWETA